MKLTIKKITQEQVEINLPAYYKTSVHYFKIYSEEKCICVTNMNDHYEIGLKHVELAFNEYSIVCNKEDFKQAYNEVSLKLKNIYESNN
jgi:hypothetical protein